MDSAESNVMSSECHISTSSNVHVSADCDVQLMDLAHMLPQPKWEPQAAVAAAAAAAGVHQQHAVITGYGAYHRQDSARFTNDTDEGVGEPAYCPSAPGNVRGGKKEVGRERAQSTENNVYVRSNTYDGPGSGAGDGRGNRTKTIAVARHCPEDLLTNQWCGQWLVIWKSFSTNSSCHLAVRLASGAC